MIIEVLVLRDIAPKAVRSFWNLPINSADRCWLSAAEPPLPKRITLALMENSFFWSNQLEESLTIWTEDTQFVLDQLEISNSNRDSLIGKIFYNKL